MTHETSGTPVVSDRMQMLVNSALGEVRFNTAHRRNDEQSRNELLREIAALEATICRAAHEPDVDNAIVVIEDWCPNDQVGFPNILRELQARIAEMEAENPRLLSEVRGLREDQQRKDEELVKLRAVEQAWREEALEFSAKLAHASEELDGLRATEAPL